MGRRRRKRRERREAERGDERGVGDERTGDVVEGVEMVEEEKMEGA